MIADVSAPAPSESVAAPAGHPRFPVADGVRGTAALVVFVGHATLLHGDPGYAWWGNYVPHAADLAVSVFFVLSAFLLYRPFVAARYGGASAPTLASFATNRVLRIVPGYWLALTGIALILGLPAVFSDRAPVYYFLLQDYSERWAFDGLTPAWTIAVEAVFYVTLPLYVLLARRFDARWRLEIACLALLWVAGNVFRAGIYHTYDHLLLPLVNFPGYLDQFALGMGLALLSVQMQERRQIGGALRRALGTPGLLVALGLILFVAICATAGFPTDFGYPPAYTGAQFALRHLVFGLCATLFVAAGVLVPSAGGPIRAILTLRPIAFVGIVSYGFYLWHLPIQFWLERHGARTWIPQFPLLGITVIAFVPAILVATLSYYGVERRFLRMKRGVGAIRGRSGLGQRHIERPPDARS